MPNIANIQNNVLSDSGVDIANLQTLLTNPVTGTGTAGQVAYWSGTSAVTGSSNLFWDAANGRLGVGTNAPLAQLQIGTATNVGDFSNPAIRLGNGLNGFYLDNNRIFIVANGGFCGGFTSGSFIGNSVFLNTSSNANDINITKLGAYRLNASGLLSGIGGNSAGDASIVTNNSARLIANFAGNILINNTDGTGRLTVRGSGTTSATTALLVQNSTPSELLSITDDGLTKFSTNQGKLEIVRSANRVTIDRCFFEIVRDGVNQNFSVSQNNGISTSGTIGIVNTPITVAPTSGTAVYNVNNINPTINQTGGANGITRGLYVNPTLTAAADWRSVETSNNTGWAIYAGGTANSYFGGNVGIGTTSPNNKLSIDGNLSVRQIDSYLQASGVTQISLTGGGGAFIDLRANNAAMLRVGSSGVFVGGDTAASSRLHVRGSGTTSATTALLVQNSTPTELFKVTDDGNIFGRFSAFALYEASTGNVRTNDIRPYTTGNTLTFNGGTSNNGTVSFDFVAFGATSQTGNNDFIRISRTYNPASGTGVYNLILATPTINQTGGANGITRGLYVNPTLTSAADWRSIETSNNTGYAIYTAGTANSYFGGNVGIGTASPSQRLYVAGDIGLQAANILNLAGDQGSGNTTGIQFSGATYHKIFIYTNNTVVGNISRDFGWGIGFSTQPSARLHVRGSGTTSATTALLVQNSTPSDLLTVQDNGQVLFGSQTANRPYLVNFDGSSIESGTGNALRIRQRSNINGILIQYWADGLFNNTTSGNNISHDFLASGYRGATGSGNYNAVKVSYTINNISGSTQTGTATGILLNATQTALEGMGHDLIDLQVSGVSKFKVSNTANAAVEITSTTQGFLPPRMTTTQRDAIATPAAGLIVYNSTNSSVDLYTSAWRSLVSTSNYDGMNISFGTTTGTKIGTATTEKLSFWNATPIVQPTNTTAINDLLVSTGLRASGGLSNFSNDVRVDGVLLETVTTNRQTASYTLALSDRGKLVEMDVATANNLTVPLDSSVAFPIGTKIDIVQYGAGQTTIVATGGVTIRSTNNWLKINARYGAATLVKIATDEWYVFGNLNA